MTWTNDDGAPHDATHDDGAWGSPTLAQNERYSHTFDEAGTFAYHCAIPPGMRATSTVAQGRLAESVKTPS